MTAVHVLLVVAFFEVAINRVAVPMLRPVGEPPWWHECLDYTGLFLFYFTGALAALLVAKRCWEVFVAPLRARMVLAHGALAVAALLAAIPLVLAVPGTLSVVLEVAFAGGLIALVAAAPGRDRDLGIQIGLGIVAIPLLLHTVSAIGAEFIWPENTFDGPGIVLAQAGVIALALAALGSPYCFAPRPFARAVARPGPVIFAMVVAGVGAVLSRFAYPIVAKVATLAIGVELNSSQADPRLALYLLAVATLAWTLASCAIAASEARRMVGAGLGLIVLGGYGFRWSHHYLLPLLGVALIVDAIHRVRDQELSEQTITAETPPIPDATWQAYIAAVAQGLKATLAEVHTLTTRGEADLASSMIVGDAQGLPVRIRIERMEGSVLALDVVLGREFDELRGATLTITAIPPRNLGINPAGPPAAPLFKAGDPAFDERFKVRGSALALNRLLDAPLRARMVAIAEGWLAYWDAEGLRYRVYPGRGAPLDHPMPLSELAHNRGATSADELVAVIALLVEIAARGVTVVTAVPSELS